MHAVGQLEFGQIRIIKALLIIIEARQLLELHAHGPRKIVQAHVALDVAASEFEMIEHRAL